MFRRADWNTSIITGENVCHVFEMQFVTVHGGFIKSQNKLWNSFLLWIVRKSHFKIYVNKNGNLKGNMNIGEI